MFDDTPRLLLVAALVACPTQLFFAQQSAPPPLTTPRPESNDLLFKSIVNRVILDVVVTLR